MSIRRSFFGQRSRVTLMALLIGLLVAVFTVSTADDGLFGDNFELFTYSEVAHGFIEVRAPDGTVRERRSTDGIGGFRRFPESMVQPGDKLVVYGGFWRSQPFAGEMTLLLAESDSYQILTPVTTLVTRLAESGQVDGSTPAQRITQAVDKLGALYMVGDDWNLPNPEWVSGDLDADIDANGGLLNWSSRLLQQVQVEFLDESHMQAFPYANAAIRDVGSGDLDRRWLPGDSGQFHLSADLTLESSAGLAFELADGPAWIEVEADGVLSYNVPASAEPGGGSLRVEVTHQTLSRSRTIALDYEVADGTVVAEQSFDATGGEIWHPNGAYGYSVPADAVSSSVTMRLIDYVDEDGELRTALRTDPSGYKFNPPLKVISSTGTASSNSRSGECSTEFESDWQVKGCDSDLYMSVVENGIFNPLTLLPNRVPESTSTISLLPGWNAGITFEQESWALGARCTDCDQRTQPVLFVHGFTQFGMMGGGSGTWGDLPELLHEYAVSEFAVYEFRYRTNARFQDLASDLGDAIDRIYVETGKPVQIIAHSFGGLVSRAYLQGLSDHDHAADSFTSCAESRHPRVTGLVTLGTPHSGISLIEQNLHGAQMPRGQQGAGNLISACTQLSCWQAGSFEPFSAIGTLSETFKVAEQPGEVPVQLADFSSNPLPVPVKSLVGLHNVGSGSSQRYGGGDFLISYQGQRFAPALSCSGSNCNNTQIPMGHRETIGDTSIGHCVTEEVLGSKENSLFPLPGQVVQASGSYYRTYYHAGKMGHPAEPIVDRDDHMPRLGSNDPGRWLSYHDGFNQILDWLENIDNQLIVNIQGQGSVEVLAGGDLSDCQGSCVLPITASSADITAQPASGASFKGFSSNCSTGGTPESCSVDVGRATTVNVAFSGGDQALLVINRSGPGQVAVEPGGQVCSLPQCQYVFAPGTEVILSAEAETGALLAGWSGLCSGTELACTLTLAGENAAKAGTQFVEQIPPKPGDIFKDCPDCPTMVEIPAGSFVMGSPPDEPESYSDERPQHTVNISAFAIGQTEVTFNEWDACVVDGGCSHQPDDEGWGRGDRPVINVNWDDAQEYVTWLSNKTGHDYRLPSESEWEYATRAGTTGRFNTGDCITTDHANFYGNNPAQGCPSGEYRGQTLPVGTFAPNAFGLHDAHGNVLEWMQDCRNSSYDGAPTDGSAWMSGDCSRSVVRGGSLSSIGQDVRSATRGSTNRSYRIYNRGLRMARSVTP